jgi:hypothetical protein
MTTQDYAEIRMSFRARTIYSYSSVLAEFDTANNILWVNKHIANYSNTSRKHANALYTAAKGLRNSPEIMQTDLDQTPIQNLNQYWEDIQTDTASYLRARTRKEQLKGIIHATYQEALRYADIKCIDKRLAVYKHKNVIFAKLMEHKLLYR